MSSSTCLFLYLVSERNVVCDRIIKTQRQSRLSGFGMCLCVYASYVTAACTGCRQTDG